MSLSPKSKISCLVLAGIIFGAAIATIAINLTSRSEQVEVRQPSYDELMQTCSEHVLQKLPVKAVSPPLYERVWRLCGNQIYNAVQLEDFKIRREKFVRQKLDERVNLWLVVTITISGILLAAIQLLLSYKLALKGRAEFAKDSELAIEAGKISLRSSITGTVILALSFAFFMVYVIYIYSIKEITFERPTNLQAPPVAEQIDETPRSNLAPDSTVPITTEPKKSP